MVLFTCSPLNDNLIEILHIIVKERLQSTANWQPLETEVEDTLT